MESHAEHVHTLKITCAPMLQCIPNENGVTIIFYDQHIQLMIIPCLVHMHGRCATLTLALYYIHNRIENCEGVITCQRMGKLLYNTSINTLNKFIGKAKL